MGTEYTNPYSPLLSPADTTYQNFTFTDLAYLIWAISNKTSSDQYYIATRIDVNPTNAATLQLPSVGLAVRGDAFTITNLSSFTIAIIASDGSSIVNITSGQSINFTVKSTTVTSSESACWQTLVVGASTNTNLLSQNLGSSLRFVTTTNDVQVAQNVASITVLPNTGQYYNLTAAVALQYSATTLVNLSTVTAQTNILLPVASTVYSTCGFYIDFVNQASYPVVLQTQSGDTINGIEIQSTTNSASFVLSPGESCRLTSSDLGGWLVTAVSGLFQNVFKNATIDLSTANYVGLDAQSTSSSTQIANIVSTPVDEWAAVAIDMSTNLDLFYSPLWTLTGTIPADVQAQIAATSGTFWIILPNNLAALYFVMAQATSTPYKFGLAAKYDDSGNEHIALPELIYSFLASGNSTWALQYSAQITTSPSTQLITSLLINSSSGDGSFPDIVDDATAQLVTITGIGGLTVSRGPAAFNSATIQGARIAVVIPGTPSIGDLVAVGVSNSTVDSGRSVTTDATFASASNTTIPTSLATKNYVASLITSPLIYKGTWDAATNTPTLANGSGTLSWTYMASDNGTVDFGAGAISFVAGDFVTYNQANVWTKIPLANLVTSVNGQVGAVQLFLQDILNVTLSAPVEGDVLTYSTTPYAFSDTLSAGTTPADTIMFKIGSNIYIAETNRDSDNIIIFASSGGSFTVSQTISVGSKPTGIAFILNGTTPTLVVSNFNANTMSILEFSGTFSVVDTISLTGTANPLGVCTFTIGSDIYFAVAESNTASVEVFKYNGSNFVQTQLLSAGTFPTDVAFWVNGSTSYLGASNSTTNNISVFSAPSATFSSSQTITDASLNAPSGIISFVRGVSNYIAVSNSSGNSISIFVSTAGSGFNFYQTISVGTTPRGINEFTLGNRQVIVTSNNGSNDITLLIATGTTNFAFYATISCGTNPSGSSSYSDNGINYLATANSGSTNITVNIATSQWVNGQSTTTALTDLSDVTITSPQDNQALVYDADTTQWVNKGIFATTSDYDTINNIVGITYTVSNTDIFSLMAITGTITFPDASLFDAGTTFCVVNSSATTIVLNSHTDSDELVGTSNSLPYYYKIEAAGDYWLVDHIRQDVYTPTVTETTITDKSIVANLELGSMVDDSIILTQANYVHGKQVFTSSGTWEVPAGVTTVYATFTAGGGGGGSGIANGTGGGGGASGVYCTYLSLTVIPGETLTITLGASGAASAVGGANGGNGGDTTISGSTSGLLLTLPGGAGGGGTPNTTYNGIFGGGKNTSVSLPMVNAGGVAGTKVAGGNGGSSIFGGAGQGCPTVLGGTNVRDGSVGGGGGGGLIIVSNIINGNGANQGGIGGAGYGYLEW